MYIRISHLLITLEPCEDNPCLNGATCANTPNGPSCKCTEGFTGELCEKEGSATMNLSLLLHFHNCIFKTFICKFATLCKNETLCLNASRVT